MSSLFIYMNGLEVGEYRQSSSGAQSFNYLEDVIKHVADQLPNDFPADVSDPIFENMRKSKQQYSTIQY